MRLLRLTEDGDFSLTEFIGKKTPRYAVLSHTWGAEDEEVTYIDLRDGTGKKKAGYSKIRFCGEQASKDGLEYFWVDTCCIDKSSSAELQESINSMFRWYQHAARCYVYLSDVLVGGTVGHDELSRSWKPAFRRSRWFTRGWTLQELIAPASVEFFSKEEKRLGDKQSLEQTLHEITGIAVQVLRGSSLSQFSAKQRMSWGVNRQTKREEDAAYCLLGIFDIQMPLLYGEGREKALVRLQREIEEPIKLLLDSLRFDQIYTRQMTIHNAHAKTCEWLLQNHEYADWLDASRLGEHHGFLWIKGKPGTGKSTLMKYAVANARKTMKDRIVISFFFNARGEKLEKSTTGTYRSLLLQLFEELPALQRIFDSSGSSRLRISNNYQWSAESLKRLLEQAIQNLGESSVFCFIDALDECEEWQIRDMISFFEHVGELAIPAGIRFQVCFSSRHYPHITIRKGLGLVLEEQGGHNQDITNYLDSELKIGHSKVAARVRTEIQQKASGIFMWVVLVVAILNKEHDAGRMHALQRRLQEIPSDLNELFRDILTRDPHNIDEFILCIQWILFAGQPLGPEQLYFAILSGVEPEVVSKWDFDEIPIDVMKRFILNSSKGLTELTVSTAPKAQFIHESVKDFLLHENWLRTIWPDLGNNFDGKSHERLKHCCLNYMASASSAYLERRKALQQVSSQDALTPSESFTLEYPFLEYAVHNILYHADMAAGYGIPQEIFLQNFQLSDWIMLSNLFEKHEIPKHTENASLLYVLAEANVPNLIRIHPSSVHSFLEMEKELYGPPLFAAIANESKQAVKTFVEAYAATQESSLHVLRYRYCHTEGSQFEFGSNFRFSSRRTILSYLAELGDELLFTIGLEKGGFDPDSTDKDGQTPLWWAAKNGHEAIVKLLLHISKINVDSKDLIGQTPLWWAVRNGHEAVVKLLLDTGKVDVDLNDSDGRTPLWWAAKNGHKAIVKLLLDTGKVDIDSRDWGRRTPLSWAAEYGHEAVVKLLLETGKVGIDSKDSGGRTPLWWAAKYARKAVVKIMLDTGMVDVNSTDPDQQTPLWWAARNGYEAVVKLLLGTDKVDINSKNRFGETPLWWAVRNLHGVIVELLLDTSEVNVNLMDSGGQTPLWWAAKYGHETLVKMLLDTGKIDVDLKDLDGRTPLWWAATMGRKTVVNMLLDTGKADVNSKDSEGRTPIFWAAKNGYKAVVKLLLNTGKVDVDSKDPDGRTPLLWAAKNGYNTVVKLLLNTGKVDVNVNDRCRRTPLWWAARSGHRAVIKLLLDTGKVDINSEDRFGQTPLQWALSNGVEVTDEEWIVYQQRMR